MCVCAFFRILEIGSVVVVVGEGGVHLHLFRSSVLCAD